MTNEEAEELICSIVNFPDGPGIAYLALRNNGFQIEMDGWFNADQLRRIADAMDEVETK